ncbi:MAG TPA: prolyl oligopeptidase family serine peptidase [Micromonosporaceae bacterium]|nr:prolyl oligopeptidase family serine peptidase [Micromonosporaceae bacterium]
MPNSAEPPIAPTEPVVRQMHGLEITDDYAWMRDATDPRFLSYVRAERAHYDRATEHLNDLRDALFAETAGRLLPTDESVSWRRGDLFYYMKSVTGSEYEQFMSTRDPAEPGRVVLDDASLATEPGGYVAVEVREVSPDNRVLAYSYDTDGDEVYTLRFRDIGTGADLPDVVSRSSEGGAWSSDSTSFFYTVHDELYRPYQVWRHRMGTDSGDDTLVYVEDDARFSLFVRASTSGDYVFIDMESRDTTETLFVRADRPEDPARPVRPRAKGVEYQVDHLRSSVPGAGSDAATDGAAGGAFVIATNLGATEFRLMTAPVDAPSEWRELAASRAGERLGPPRAFAGHLVLPVRRDGFPLLRIVDVSLSEGDVALGPEREITAGIEAGRIAMTEHHEYDAGYVTVEVESIIEPPAWYDVDLATGTRTLRKRLDVPGYDATAYRTARHDAPAADGTLVPVTLAWRSDTPLDGTAPCLVWGYGAYEACDDPWFDPALVSALDRGVVFALSSPRGGGENGRRWWLNGHLAAKANTFTDHVAVANWLAGAAPNAAGGTGDAADGHAALIDPERIVTRGLSAGGLLQAAALNAAPRRWRAVVAEVPFVDVIGSMSDPSIPLTINEWEEWGDPRKPDEFAWMYAYSPYDNMPPSPRPRMLVTAAMHDPRVLVHEPTKWVAKLRATASPGDELFFRVELGAGAHTGPAGRYAHVRYEAEVYAFILDALGSATRQPDGVDERDR